MYGDRKMVLSFGRNRILLSPREVLFGERSGKFTFLVTTSKKRVKVRENLEEMIHQSQGSFVQCHRSYVINRNYLYRINYTELVLLSPAGEKKEIPIGRTFKRELERVCMGHVAEGED